jgi:hypothetical protein
MNLKPALAILIPVFLLSIFCPSAKCQDLKKVIDRIYNFSPGSMSKAQQEEKLKPMDNFWDMVTSDTSRWLPGLRKELEADGHHPFFYFDGSFLLLSISQSQSDKLLTGEAIARCDVADIKPELYVRRLNGLAFDGVDITRSALKILSDPNFSFAIPEHAMVFDRDNCLAYCLLPLDSRLYTDQLIELFKTQDPLAQESILYTLWLGYSCSGDEFIKKEMTDQSLSATIREGAVIIDSLSRTPIPSLDKYYNSSAAEIIGIRNEALRRFSNEAIDDLMITSMALRAKVKGDQAPLEASGAKRTVIDHNALAKRVVALDEYQAEKARVDSLNKTGNNKTTLSFTIYDKSDIQGDDPEVVALCLVTESTGNKKQVVFTIKYDKFKQEFISVERN